MWNKQQELRQEERGAEIVRLAELQTAGDESGDWEMSEKLPVGPSHLPATTEYREYRLEGSGSC